MKKIYHLSTCSTCKRIISELNLGVDFVLQDIKTERITENQLNEMVNLAGSYESLFSRRAVKYKELGLKDQELTENDFKKLILEDYTFLKRPVILIGENIFIGNAKKTIEDVKTTIS